MVSVVVPLYNNEALIGRCLNSLLSQDYKPLEIIVVDDGSTDTSFEEAKRYESASLKIYHKTNGGPGIARNYGLNLCSEDSHFVMFVDSDDTVEPNYVSSMVNLATENNLVICGINDCVEDSESIKNTIQASGIYASYDKIWNNIEFLKLLSSGIINSSCNKCYSLDVIRQNNVVFGSSYPEDTRFNIEYLKYCPNVIVLQDKLYNYIHRCGSVTAKPFESLYTGYIDIQNTLSGIVQAKNHKYILEFVYPQYLGNTKNYLKSHDYKTPKKYLRLKPIHKAIRCHKPTCFGDAVVKYLLLFRFYRLLMKL